MEDNRWTSSEIRLTFTSQETSLVHWEFHEGCKWISVLLFDFCFEFNGLMQKRHNSIACALELNHCSPVTSYGDIDLGQYWHSRRVGVNSIPELELRLNSNSGIGIGIEIGGIENGIGIEIPGIGIGIGIENWNWIFCNCYRSTYYLLVNQPFPNFIFKRGGHNLSCDWLLMQQVCFLSSWDIAPCGVVTKDHGEGNLYPLSRQRSEGLKMVTINISSPPWCNQKLFSLLNKLMISGLGVKSSQHISFSLILLIGIFRSFMILHKDKCHRPYWSIWWAHIVSDNGLALVPSCKKPLPESVLSKISDAIFHD